MGGNNKRFRGRRLVAVLGALTLSLAGAAAATTTASAADDYGNINSSKTGAIVIHKHVHQVTVAVTASPDGSKTIPSDPILGVTFTAYKVTAIDLTNPAGWTAVAALNLTTACTGTLPQTGTTAAGSATTDASGVATITPLNVGAYIVCETGQPANVVDKAQPFVVTIPYPYQRTVSGVAKESWLYDVNVYPKNGVASIAKTVNAPSSLGLGATDSFTVTADIPAIGTNEVFTHYWVKDPMDTRLTPLAVPSANVTIVGGSAVPAANYVATVSGQVVTLQFTSAGLTYLQGLGGKKLQVIFPATVSTLGATAISNTASFSVGTKVGTGTQTPDDPGTTATALASAAVTQSWGDLVVRKVDAGDNTSVLGGAVFEVWASSAPDDATCTSTTPAGASAISVKGVTQFTTDSITGLVTIPGLFVADSVTAPGVSQRCYVLKEITAPVGFITPVGSAQFTAATVKTGVTGAGVYGATVKNTRQLGVTLPMTGSNGIVVLSLAGLALIAAGVVLAILARRRKQTA